MHVFPVARRVPFVTVSSCTGTDGAARDIEKRTAGAVESMEGAAVAHVAHLHGVPVGEVRGISNIVTNRDTTTWRLREAAAAAQEAVLSWILTAELRLLVVSKRHLRVSRPGARARAGAARGPYIDDVEALNARAERGDAEVTKISIAAYGRIRDRYALCAQAVLPGSV